MMLRWSHAALAAFVFCLPVLSAHAAHADCSALLGTFLTKNTAKDEDESKFLSRSLISFVPGGLAFFTDSGEAGEEDFAPFSDGRGAWRCDGGTMKATVLDFTFPESERSKQQIGRLDFELSYNAKQKTVSGTATLYLLPFDSDPLGSDIGEGRQFEIEGSRVEAP